MGQSNQDLTNEVSKSDGQGNLAPNLTDSFIPLPPPGTKLSPEQLEAIFGGDMRTFQDMARLAYQSNDNAAE